MSKPALGAGNVEIELDGETVVLRPSLMAAQAISRQSGGISSAVRSVGNYDFDVIVSVVTLGLGATGQEAKAIPEKVWRTGLTDLIGPVSTYLTIIANGGRPMSGGEEAADPQKKE
ncbi:MULTISPECIES: hypothetical protein [Mesorhizobium]|uniref:Uncharacterized protein n=2 Tax=Mesorhizobium TaxID=68287 RepID=A0A1A5J615_RHILI|nr:MULTISPECIES: hypothetical protein [Mesorhizobium]ETA72341.1 hypothetical protein MesloDRAFT_1211 [Mesorhizobium japonicum R7A]MBE1709672.1 hypothetical protein [Mesorhizobium japonicum]MBE1714341.1 hypothetical protein [Mesorhizobium japonicum]MUT25322.1 hypothetical protein [Mesorhizobium japonicum]MUT28624.1 hypothetical protein [Mesorhizobium japonicum]